VGEHVTDVRKKTSANQGDLLLWVAGAAVAAVGVAWLVIMKPWGGADTVSPAPAPAQATAPATEVTTLAMADGTPAPHDDTPTPPADEAALDNPLRMAELAYDAGMLIDPEEYSAWTLYSRVAKAEPGNAAAVAGLNKVADDLVRRGETALEQGRFDDARHMVERIREALPGHPGAKALAARIWPQSAPDRPAPEIPKPVPAETPRVARVEIPAAPAKPAVDPIKQASDEFMAAMAAGRLLTPPDKSAKHFLNVLVTANRDHALTQRARDTLSRELLSRASQSIEALDDEAAAVWIDEAQAIGVNADGVSKARSALNDHLIALEAAKPVPASALKVVSYVPPAYPQRALERRLEGWVDVEFTVATDGTTKDIVVTDSSNDSLFHREAIDAVKQWRFEPRVFMNRTIEQHSYTRMKFVQ
jgi:TonB family protein